MLIKTLHCILLCIIGAVLAADLEKGEMEVTSSADTLVTEIDKSSTSQEQNVHAIHPEQTKRYKYIIEAVYYHNMTCFT